jgi:hypothetical protein
VNPVALVSGEKVQVIGSRLETIERFEIAGLRVEANCQEKLCTFTAPQFLTSCTQDLIAFGSFGSLRVQDAVTTTGLGSLDIEGLKIWTKKISDTQVKIYAKNIVGAGKVQFMFNGREIAWVRAADTANPKLRFAKGFYYLVRTVDLVPGQKNVIEGYVNGERLRRTAYSLLSTE